MACAIVAEVSAPLVRALFIPERFLHAAGHEDRQCPRGETGLARLKASPITELIVTDTVPQHEYAADARITTLSVAELFGEAIRRIHNNESVNSLFAI